MCRSFENVLIDPNEKPYYFVRKKKDIIEKNNVDKSKQDVLSNNDKKFVEEKK